MPIALVFQERQQGTSGRAEEARLGSGREDRGPCNARMLVTGAPHAAAAAAVMHAPTKVPAQRALTFGRKVVSCRLDSEASRV